MKFSSVRLETEKINRKLSAFKSFIIFLNLYINYF